MLRISKSYPIQKWSDDSNLAKKSEEATKMSVIVSLHIHQFSSKMLTFSLILFILIYLVSSIDSINQMKEQLKCLSDTLKMDIKCNSFAYKL